MSASIKLNQSRLYLRPIKLDDVNDNYCAWLADPEVNQFLETRFQSQTKQMIRDFVASKMENPNEPLWAICDRATDRHIGNIKLGPINHHHQRADISLLIGDKAFWGKGYATEAIAAIVEHAFNTLQLNKLQAGAYSNNVGSINAFKKNGFSQEGFVKEFGYLNAEPIDMILMGLTRSDYLSKQQPVSK